MREMVIQLAKRAVHVFGAGVWEAISLLPSRTARRRQPFATGEAIDVVYTWVDGSDPEWRRRRNKASVESGRPNQFSNFDGLFTDSDELRYSFRSLERFMPWVRHVWVVTDRQTPNWLRLDNPQVTVVDHRDIFPESSVLPTFNSHAIEACLHRIEGLSRRFIYFNDDVLLSAPVSPNDFFSEGRPIFRTHGVPRIVPGFDALPYVTAAVNARRLIENLHGNCDLGAVLAHVPHPCDRSLLAEADIKFSGAIERTRAAQFRSMSDVPPITLAAMHGLATGRSVLRITSARESMHVPVGGLSMSIRMLEAAVRRPKFVCVNTSPWPEIPIVRTRRMLRQFLEWNFPVPSRFEHG